MRRAICFILVLAFCLSLSCTAFAAQVSSAADSGTPSRVPSHNSGSNPKTGDIIMQWVLIMVLALVALAVVIWLYRKFAC